MDKEFAENQSRKINFGKMLNFIHLPYCHPELACQGGAERRLVEGSIEWIVALREPQCDSTFSYYVYILFLTIRMSNIL